MTENHILDVLNNQFQFLMTEYNETLERCLHTKKSIGEVPNFIESKFISIDHTIEVFMKFARTVGWAVIMDVDTDGFITRLKVI